METWGGRRSAAYASMCGPLLPFLREGGPGAGFAEFSKGRGVPPRACRCGVPKWTFGEFSKKCLLARAAIFIGFGHLSKSDNVFNRSTTDGCEIPTASAISCCFLDTCLNCNKIASSRVRVWERFWRILQKRLLARAGVGKQFAPQKPPSASESSSTSPAVEPAPHRAKSGRSSLAPTLPPSRKAGREIVLEECGDL